MEQNPNSHEPSSEEAPSYVSYLSDNFSSLYFGKVPEPIEKEIGGVIAPSKTQKLIASLVSLLTDARHQVYRHDVLQILKNNNAQEALVHALHQDRYANARHAIITACWESGLDFSDYLPVFVELAVSESYLVCLECMTVIEEMTGGFAPAEIEEQLGKLNAHLPEAGEKHQLITEIINQISAFKTKI
jgi:hypothetical protein